MAVRFYKRIISKWKRKRKIVKDILGNILEVGDVVFRAKHSIFTIHKIEKITRKAIVVSCKKQEYQGYRYEVVHDIETEGSTRYRIERVPYTYRYVTDTYTVESLAQHDYKLYVSLPWSTGTISEEDFNTHEVELKGFIKIQTLTIQTNE